MDVDSPAALFASYEQDFHQILDGVRQKLDGDGRGEERKAALRKVEIELDEADDIISQMEIELSGIPQSMKSQYQARLKTAKTALTRFKKLSKETHSQLARSDLLSSSTRSGGYANATTDEPYEDERAQLLQGTATLSDGSRRLQEAQRIALETENQGADILRNLRQQREQIENSRDVLHAADSHIERASGTINTMIRRMYRHRVMYAIIVVVLLVVVILIVWAKLRGH